MNNGVTIRLMEQRDVKLVHKWRNDPRIRQYMFNPNPIYPNGHAAWFEKSSQDPKCHLMLASRGDVPFGFAQFNLSNCTTVAEWGFYVDPDGPKRQGYALGHAVLSFGFGVLQIHRITGNVLNENFRSIEYHKRLGFIHEGVLKSHHLTEHGHQDVHLFGLLSTEWTKGLINMEPMSSKCE